MDAPGNTTMDVHPALSGSNSGNTRMTTPKGSPHAGHLQGTLPSPGNNYSIVGPAPLANKPVSSSGNNSLAAQQPPAAGNHETMGTQEARKVGLLITPSPEKPQVADQQPLPAQEQQQQHQPTEQGQAGQTEQWQLAQISQLQAEEYWRQRLVFDTCKELNQFVHQSLGGLALNPAQEQEVERLMGQLWALHSPEQQSVLPLFPLSHQGATQLQAVQFRAQQWILSSSSSSLAPLPACGLQQGQPAVSPAAPFQQQPVPSTGYLQHPLAVMNHMQPAGMLPPPVPPNNNNPLAPGNNNHPAPVEMDHLAPPVGSIPADSPTLAAMDHHAPGNDNHAPVQVNMDQPVPAPPVGNFADTFRGPPAPAPQPQALLTFQPDHGQAGGAHQDLQGLYHPLPPSPLPLFPSNALNNNLNLLTPFLPNNINYHITGNSHINSHINNNLDPLLPLLANNPNMTNPHHNHNHHPQQHLYPDIPLQQYLHLPRLTPQQQAELAFLEADQARLQREVNQLLLAQQQHVPPKQYVRLREVQKRPLTMEEVWGLDDWMTKKRKLMLDGGDVPGGDGGVGLSARGGRGGSRARGGGRGGVAKGNTAGGSRQTGARGASTQRQGQARAQQARPQGQSQQARSQSQTGIATTATATTNPSGNTTRVPPAVVTNLQASAASARTSGPIATATLLAAKKAAAATGTGTPGNNTVQSSQGSTSTTQIATSAQQQNMAATGTAQTSMTPAQRPPTGQGLWEHGLPPKYNPMAQPIARFNNAAPNPQPQASSNGASTSSNSQPAQLASSQSMSLPNNAAQNNPQPEATSRANNASTSSNSQAQPESNNNSSTGGNVEKDQTKKDKPNNTKPSNKQATASTTTSGHSTQQSPPASQQRSQHRVPPRYNGTTTKAGGQEASH